MLNDRSTGQATRRGLQAQEMRARLIETALSLFAAQGFDNTTIKDIAKAAGVAQGLPYHYFRSKEDLFWAIIEGHSFLAHLQQILEEAADRPVGEALRDVALAFHRFLTVQGLFVRLLLRELQTNPRVAEVWAQKLNVEAEPLRRFVAGRVAAGELRPHNTEATVVALMYPLVMMQVPGMQAMGDSEPLIADMVEVLTRGIAA